MKITLCGSINFADRIISVHDQLAAQGHEVFLPQSILDFSIKNNSDAKGLKEDREKYIHETKPHYTLHHFNLIEKSDAILVINQDKNGIRNYIGGATFAEIMLAFHLGKKIFFLNPTPNDERLSFMIDELQCVKPNILNGDLNSIY